MLLINCKDILDYMLLLKLFLVVEVVPCIFSFPDVGCSLCEGTARRGPTVL